MASMQAPIGTSKSAKFQAANLLGPMADPFAGMSEDQKEYQEALSESVNQRLTGAMAELKDKHARGVHERDDPERAPTGEPYRQIQYQHLQQAKADQAHKEQERLLELKRIQDLKLHVQRQVKTDDNDENDEEDDDSDAEWLDELESDPTLEALREQRLAQLRQERDKILEHKARGHGECRTISQDEFLPECTASSDWVVVLFFHDDFEKCKVMDHHLKHVAVQHLECKFLRIDAQKAPFFCTKLKIKTLPTLLVFHEGKAVNRMIGFEGIAEGNEWPTSLLQKWLSKTGAIKYQTPTEEVQQDMKRLGITVQGSIWRGGTKDYDDEDDYYELRTR